MPRPAAAASAAALTVTPPTGAPREDRWVCLAAGFVCIICAGTVYGFGAVRADLKRALNDDDDTHIAAISLMGNSGLWIGSFLGGMLADGHGPRLAMLAGAALFLVGYGGMWLGLSHTIDALRHYQIVAALWLCAGLGSGFVYNATVFTNSQNFGVAGRARVIGLLATLFQTGPAAWTIALDGCVGGDAQLQPTTAAAATNMTAAAAPLATLSTAAGDGRWRDPWPRVFVMAGVLEGGIGQAASVALGEASHRHYGCVSI